MHGPVSYEEKTMEIIQVSCAAVICWCAAAACGKYRQVRGDRSTQEQFVQERQ